MNEDYLSHHGIKGQKWGIRRYQNPDGSLTDAGMKRYGKETTKKLNQLDKDIATAITARERAGYRMLKSNTELQRLKDEGKLDPNSKKTKKVANMALKSIKDFNEADATVKGLESEIWKTIGDSVSKGYAINSEPVMRMGTKGQKVLASMGIVGAAVNTSLYTHDKRKYGSDAGAGYVKGAKYKVTKAKPGETATARITAYR